MATNLRVSDILITAMMATLIVSPCLFVYTSVEQIQSWLTYLKVHAESGDVPEFTPKELQKLEDLLARATMPNKTVIITTLNEAWAANDSMINLYLLSFHRGENTKKLLDHMVIVTLDQKAHDRCLQLHPHCFRLKTSGVDFTEEKKFMSADYLKMMWRRIRFLGDVLELGYSFVFSDADIIWFRDPFTRFFEGMDFQISCDRYYGRPFHVEKNAPNGGYVYVRSNQRTIEMYRYWYNARLKNPGKHDQDVLNVIFREEEFGRIGVKIRFLDTVYFSGFCQKSKNMTKVVTMHANCCKGLSNKLKDLRLALDDWSMHKNVDSLEEGKNSQQLKLWRAPLACLSSKWF